MCESDELDRLDRDQCSFVELGEGEQVLDQPGHPRRLALDTAEHPADVLFVGDGTAAEQFGVGRDSGDRGPQLVRSVGDEATQPFLGLLQVGKGVLDPIEHHIESGGDVSHLGAGIDVAHPVLEVAAGDRVGGRFDVGQRPQTEFDENQAEEDGDDDRRRSD